MIQLDEKYKETLPIRLDFQQKTTLTEQIRRAIYGFIERQELEPGDLLPTVRQLALQLGVNFNTTARAYRALDAAGVITTRQGRGTYVVGMPGSMESARAGKESIMLVKERIEQVLREAEKDGVSRQEMNEALMALILARRSHGKVKTHFRKIKSRKTNEQSEPGLERRTAALLSTKIPRVSKRRTSHTFLFHVKQRRSRNSE